MSDDKLPPLLKQVQNLLEAKSKWKAAGEPMRSPEEIAVLFAICEECPRFQRVGPDIGRCKECGCWLKRKGESWNKPALATEDCPLGRWSTPAASQTDMPDTH